MFLYAVDILICKEIFILYPETGATEYNLFRSSMVCTLGIMVSFLLKVNVFHIPKSAGKYLFWKATFHAISNIVFFYGLLYLSSYIAIQLFTIMPIYMIITCHF